LSSISLPVQTNRPHCHTNANPPPPTPRPKVIVDPPSFAPSKQSVPKATASYERLFAKAAEVTAP
jgi:hypothetical protein